MKTKVLFSTFLVFILFFSTQEIWAQWKQESGPYGGWVYTIESNDDYCYIYVSGSMYRSADGGDNWDKIQIEGSASNGRVFTNKNRLATITYGDDISRELFISEDNGDSWQQIPLVDSISSIIYRAFNTSSGIYVANFNDIWVSNDMGETWEYAVINDEIIYLSAMEVFDEKIYFGGHGKIARIEENGTDWEVLNIPMANQSIDNIFVDGDIILAPGGQFNNLYRSDDAGNSWEELEGEWSADNHKAVKINATYYILDGLELYASENQGQSWSVITTFSYDTTMTCFGKSGDNLIMGSYFQGIFKSTDLGLTWTGSSAGINKADIKYIIQAENTQLTSSYRRIFKKENAATTWGTTNLFPEMLESPQLAYSNGNIFIAGTFNFLGGNTFKSHDFGNTWINITPEVAAFNFFNHVHAENEVLYIWEDDFFNGLMKSEDEGDSWSDIEANLEAQLGAQAHYYSMDNGKIYALVNTNNEIVKSIDRGETWSLITPNTVSENIHFNKLEIRNGVLFANSGENHLYISHDEGENFFNVNTEIPSINPNAPIFNEVKGLSEDVFILVTSGANESVYITFNKGFNWTLFIDGLEEGTGVNTILISDTYLLIGTESKGIWKRSLGDIEGIDYISGHVYKDEDGNGMKGTNEQNSTNTLLSLNDNRFATTDLNGDYSFYTFGGSGDTIKAIKPSLYTEMNPVCHVVSTNDSLYTFGVYVLPHIKDLQITITPVTAPRPGFNHKYLITYKNVGTVTLDGQVSFDFEEILTYLDASPLPNEAVESNLTWDYFALAPEESRNITVTFNIPATMPIGTILSSLVGITPINGDEQTSDNLHPIREEVVGSFDPNDKSVEPKDEFTTDQLASGEKLVYTIRFQNTGNFPAEFVRITDQLQSTLDVTTFEVLSASHPYTYTIKGTGLVEFFFDNIQLPDSTSNELESHGFIKFAIAAKEYLPLGFTIENFADIYFDYNIPIRTNTAETTITSPTFISALIEAPTPIKIFPTPSKGLLTLAFEEPIYHKMNFFIVDNTGKRVKTGEIKPSANAQLNLSALPAGLYYVLIKAKDKNYIGKILIQK